MHHISHFFKQNYSLFQQIWWSSPISGPRRYEYEDGLWVHTRSVDGGGEHTTLATALAEEVKQMYDMDLEVDI